MEVRYQEGLPARQGSETRFQGGRGRKGEGELRDSPPWDIYKRRSLSCLSFSPTPSLPPLLLSAMLYYGKVMDQTRGALHPGSALLHSS